jgi:hypothetical protein
LRGDENRGIVIKEQAFTPLEQRGKAGMVGKLLMERPISKEILKMPMIPAWKPTGRVSFKTLGPNLFIIDFENWWDRDKILEAQPWTFDGSLFFVVDFDISLS